jgi:hypothetical protein
MYALMIFKVFQKLFTVLLYTFIYYLFASLSFKLLTNFVNACWNPPQNSLLWQVNVL